MTARSVKSPTIPIPFHKLLKVQRVFQERVDGCIKFHTYVVRE